jgi:hypothetical protein
MRLDSAAFRDPMTNRWWLGYRWYTNVPPMVPQEPSNNGLHASLKRSSSFIAVPSMLPNQRTAALDYLSKTKQFSRPNEQAAPRVRDARDATSS